MLRFQSKISRILVIVIGFVLLAVWSTSALPAASPLAAGVDRANATQSNFVDSGQELGGNVESSAVALGDLDGDGDLDAVVASFGGASSVYLNQGGDQGGTEGVFLDSGQGLSASLAVDVELTDLDGDTDLDIFLVKDAFGDSNEVWLNQGVATAVFTQTAQTFGDSLSTSVAVGDLDGVNGPDAFVGRGFGQPSKVWFNSGSGTLSDSGQTLDTDSGDIALGDLDGDNDLDAFSANGGDNKIWVNQGGAQMGAAGFLLDSGQVLTSALSLSAALGDIDGDGDLDAWVGNSGDDRIWVNQGGVQGGTEGDFLEGALTSASQTRDVALADLDGDGDRDAFLTKGTGNEVWINQGGDQGGNEGEFLDSGQSLGNSMSEGLALGDVDGDGDLDAFVTNWGQPDKVWLNESGGGNEQAGLFSAGNQDLGANLDHSIDLALGDLDQDGDLDAVMAKEKGLAEGGGEVWLNGIAGNPIGVFSLSQEFGSQEGNAIVLGDVDNDSDLDALMSVDNGFEIWLNGEGTDPPGILSPGQQEHGSVEVLTAALADVDGDGDLDALVAIEAIDYSLQVWLNGENGDPPGIFSQDQVLAIYVIALATGDLDGDGDLDILASSLFESGNSLIRVLLNGEGGDPAGVFSIGQEIFVGEPVLGVALGDLEGDGDLDAFLAINGPNRILVNGFQGNEGTFSDSGNLLGNVLSTDVALGDLDGDGDLDAFTTTGREVVLSQSNEIWENGGDNLGTQCLGSVESEAIALGDLDGDGDLDAFVANINRPDKVWFNGQGMFCSCIVASLYEESVPIGVDNPPVVGSNLFSHLSLGSGLQTYLDLRDDLFSQYVNGRRYARLYDDHNAEIYSLLFANASLRDEGLATLQIWQPGLQALLDGQGDTVTISAAQVQAVDDFLTNLTAVASPDLQQVIAAERAKLPPPPTFIGMTMEEARGIVLPDMIYLPSILRQ